MQNFDPLVRETCNIFYARTSVRIFNRYNSLKRDRKWISNARAHVFDQAHRPRAARCGENDVKGGCFEGFPTRDIVKKTHPGDQKGINVPKRF